jgi:hypothetical protein
MIAANGGHWRQLAAGQGGFRRTRMYISAEKIETLRKWAHSREILETHQDRCQLCRCGQPCSDGTRFDTSEGRLAQQVMAMAQDFSEKIKP